MKSKLAVRNEKNDEYVGCQYIPNIPCSLRVRAQIPVAKPPVAWEYGPVPHKDARVFLHGHGCTGKSGGCTSMPAVDVISLTTITTLPPLSLGRG